MARRFADYEIDEMVRLYVDHRWPVRQIARKFGCSYGKMRRILDSQEVLRKRGRKFDREEIDKIIALYVQHKWGVNDVAHELGAPPTAVYRLLKRRGLNRSRSEAQIARTGGIDTRIEYIYVSLQTAIVNGELKEGSQLPNRDELRKLFSVNYRALREAIYDLEYDGYIVTVKPYGTFVCGRDNWKISSDPL